VTTGSSAPKINLHDVRHSYAIVGRDAKIDWKPLSTRIGHSDIAFTMRQYVQTDLEADRQVANTLATLIIGGSLATFDVSTGANAPTNQPARPGRMISRPNKIRLANPLASDSRKARKLLHPGL